MKSFDGCVVGNSLVLTSVSTMSHYPERASASGSKGAATQRFGRSNVVSDIFIRDTFFLHLITLLVIHFSKTFLSF